MLRTVSLACAFAVAAVLIGASVSKLRSPALTRAATNDLGAPIWLAMFVAPVELVSAVVLLVRPHVGAVLAVVLLTAFSVLLRRVVLSGRVVRCGCFGAGTSEPVTQVTLLRNFGLIGVSVVAFFAPPAFDASASELMASACVALGVVSTGLLVLALADLRRVTGAVFPTARSEV